MREHVLEELVKRTNGDVYIGVVGPVRVGKSVLVKKMMEMIVLPHITDADVRMKTIDELPQSSPGPVIMTSEPKFVPAQATPVKTEQLDVPFRIRFADCVGYVIDGAKGYEHDGGPKLVHTPWHHDPIPFRDAAKIGTDKVIRDHANIGIVVTTDGTVNGFSRTAVQSVEAEIVAELQGIGKPFIIVLNSMTPGHGGTIKLRNELVEKYAVPVLAMNIDKLTLHEVDQILSEALLEFPIHQVILNKPDWVDVLDANYPINSELQVLWDEIELDKYRVRDVEQIATMFLELSFITKSELYEVDAGTGSATIQIQYTNESYKMACEKLSETALETKRDWLLFVKDAAEAKKTQERFKEAIGEAESEGYGIAIPTVHQFEPEQPELVKQNNFFGVRMKTVAPSYHIIRVDLEAEFAPLIGSEFHSQQLLNELQKAFDTDREKLWKTSLFGTPLDEVLKESMKFKMNAVPETAKKRMRQTIERMVNEGDRGLITFII